MLGGVIGMQAKCGGYLGRAVDIPGMPGFKDFVVRHSSQLS